MPGVGHMSCHRECVGVAQRRGDRVAARGLRPAAGESADHRIPGPEHACGREPAANPTTSQLPSVLGRPCSASVCVTVLLMVFAATWTKQAYSQTANCAQLGPPLVVDIREANPTVNVDHHNKMRKVLIDCVKRPNTTVRLGPN